MAFVKRFSLLILAITAHLATVKAQSISNRGKEFWLGYGLNYIFFGPDGNLVDANSQELALYISTELPATVTVSINGTSWTQTLNIPANTVNATIIIPKSGPDDARLLTDGFSNRAIHVVSDVPVAVFAHQYSIQNSGATMLIPVESYGYSYHSINYYQTSADLNQPNWYCYFYAVASEDNTRLEITPTDSTKNGWLAGQTHTVNLNKGEIFSVFGKAIFNGIPAFGSKDLTGSKIVSIPGADGKCHPFALFSGSGGIRICKGDGADIMHQQVFPTQSWGTNYLTYHTIVNGNTDLLPPHRNYYRVCVSDPTAVVRRNGVPLTGLIKNFFYEFLDSTGGDFIVSDKPVLVSQYTPSENECWKPPLSPSPFNPPTYGDPEMMYLSSLEQGQKSVIVWASRKTSGIVYVYFHMIVPTAGLSSLLVDGSSLPPSQIIPHPNHPGYSVAIARHFGPAAQHTITCDSAFTGIIYGLGNFESYGYNIGSFVNNLNYYSSIKNALSPGSGYDTSTCPTTPVRLFFKSGYALNNIHWKLSQVAGMTPNTADSIIANPVPVATEQINGRTYYVYSLQQDFTFPSTGTYRIPVDYSSLVITNCSQTESGFVTVKVNPGPKADFNVANLGCLVDTVLFNANNTTAGYTINSYLWNFDDATTQNTLNAKKRFATTGIQNVRYRIFASNGCVGDTIKQITINQSPVSRPGASSPVCLKDSVLISDTSSISQGSINNWFYNFGDGNTVNRSSGASFKHKYANPGTYTIKLVTTSNNGCKSDTAFAVVLVNPSPAAKFGYDRNICVNDSIRITDTSSIAAPGFIASYRWDFGDGNTLVRTVNTPFYHPYTITGNFTVKLVTVSDLGCVSDTFNRPVSVSAKPVASLSFTGRPCIDSNFVFTSSYTNAPGTTWRWNFGDGNTANLTTGNTVSHAYASVLSNINVRHVVDVGQGCVSDTAVIPIPNINPNPTVSFTIKKDTVCTGMPILFTSPTTGVAQWIWNFGNGTGANVPSFTRVYPIAGTYNISLVVKDTIGCGSTPQTDVLIVNPMPLVNAGPDKLIQTGSSTTLDGSVTPPGPYTYLWSPTTGLNSAGILIPNAAPAVTTTYLLEVDNPITHCAGKDQVTIQVISKLYIPNAFTPNGDGKNDTWKIPGMPLYPDALVQIFNRYGQKIFEKTNYNGHEWDGSFKGVQQPTGAYIYQIQLNNTAKETLTGTIMIIR